ncbi:hypothetical protein EDB83DRAFT_27151 [Lactarius deliciosus]|nr:hypothetical protein EDB83DRAFT_27151 [Lactarius deliciosus]
MPALALALVATAAVFVIGSYFFGGNDDGSTPPNDPYRSSQQPRRPPPSPPPYTYRPPTTYARSQTTSRASAPSDQDRGVYHSPYTPTPSQTQLSSTRSDTLVGVEDLEFAEKLREKARRSGREMTEAYSRAKSAQRMGDRWAAQEHRRRGDAHKSMMEELDKRAAKIIFRENNKDRDDGMVDLHRLYVAEAVRFAKEQLRSARLKRNDVVYFIVGKGLHSDAGGARIRPALEVLCTEQGLGHSLHPNNAGVLVVRLD